MPTMRMLANLLFSCRDSWWLCLYITGKRSTPCSAVLSRKRSKLNAHAFDSALCSRARIAAVASWKKRLSRVRPSTRSPFSLERVVGSSISAPPKSGSEKSTSIRDLRDRKYAVSLRRGYGSPGRSGFFPVRRYI